MIALDTNILIYAYEDGIKHKNIIARNVIQNALMDGAIVPLQAVGEYLAVVRRKRREMHGRAVETVEGILSAFAVPSSTTGDLLDAFALASRCQLQYFDALIIAVAARAGATTLYSEDMQHGFAIAGLTITNPFDS